MIHVTELAVLLDLPFTVTLRACSLFYRKKVTLKVMRITLIKGFLVGRVRIHLMAGAAAVLRIHQVDAFRIKERDMGAVRIGCVRSRLARPVAPLGLRGAVFVF